MVLFRVAPGAMPRTAVDARSTCERATLDRALGSRDGSAPGGAFGVTMAAARSKHRSRSGAVERTCVHTVEHDDASANSPLPRSAEATNVLSSYRRRRNRSVVATLTANWGVRVSETRRQPVSRPAVLDWAGLVGATLTRHTTQSGGTPALTTRLMRSRWDSRTRATDSLRVDPVNSHDGCSIRAAIRGIL